MFYMFIKMSSKWFCKEVDSLFAETENIRQHMANGEIVVLVDDIEEFCYTMEVKMDEIEMVD